MKSKIFTIYQGFKGKADIINEILSKICCQSSKFLYTILALVLKLISNIYYFLINQFILSNSMKVRITQPLNFSQTLF
jgi:hypothetical protein